MGDALLTILVKKGVDVTTIAHDGTETMPVSVRRAVLARDPECVVEICSAPTTRGASRRADDQRVASTPPPTAAACVAGATTSSTTTATPSNPTATAPTTSAARLSERGESDMSDDPIAACSSEIRIGEIEKVDVVVVDYDDSWPARFEAERRAIELALGRSAIVVEHVGSTSVPELAAKPVIDICLVVDDSADEPAYVPALESEGYELRVREPDWQEHRMLRSGAREVHIHVFSAGSSEVDRHLVFRDWLRSHPDDCARYESTKKDSRSRTGRPCSTTRRPRPTSSMRS